MSAVRGGKVTSESSTKEESEKDKSDTASVPSVRRKLKYRAAHVAAQAGMLRGVYLLTWGVSRDVYRKR